MKRCSGRATRRSKYPCHTRAVWALTTAVRAEWTFACAQHLHQVLTGMADQIDVEVVRADRLTEGGVPAVDVDALVREILTTYPAEYREVWTVPHVRAEARDAGLPEVGREAVHQALKNLADQGVLTVVGQVGEYPQYRLAGEANVHSG